MRKTKYGVPMQWTQQNSPLLRMEGNRKRGAHLPLWDLRDFLAQAGHRCPSVGSLARQAPTINLWLISHKRSPVHKTPKYVEGFLSSHRVLLRPPYCPYRTPTTTATKTVSRFPLDGQFSTLRRPDGSTVPSTSAAPKRNPRTACHARSEGSRGEAGE